jgi:hypothetical protein
MAEPDWNPDTAGRSLAEILREAGIEAPRSGRRGRRWEDDDTGIRQRRSGPPSGDQARYGRRASDLRVDEDAAARAPAEPSTAAIPGLRPSRTPDVPGPSTPPPVQRERRASERTPDRVRDTGRQPFRDGDLDRDPARPRGRERDREPGREATPARRERAAESPVERTGRVTDRPVRRTPVDPHPSTGPIPVVRAGDAVLEDEEAGPKESALAWLRFAGELVIALAAGVGIYFLATVLWEQVPYLAVVLVPLAVTGLVAGVSAFRRRLGREPMGVPLLAVLVFAGVLLTVLPAAEVALRG